ncbi:hypothetical protein CVO77_18250 [Sphingopyxis lindanitolerans]|uniref:Haem-binding uptake Tiki superfamily ChaN domain-containing protein n=1 Tax=Sphingopyxis lindanitolerans TaxID=2054227 RepID=A0A2S8B3H8_9SPHN|nr:hypothetical protein [Sphingopyxis lindanitolerans]PQM26917.1 hypothetical protein CVO77_18250 [Sphingopyxis lindanitolerans]
MSLIAGLFLLVAGQSELPDASKSSQCSVPKGWDAIVDRDPRFVVFGEQHGTQQAPAFIADLACALSSKGQRTLVAVELSAADDRKLQDAWKLPANQFAGSLLEIGWRGRKDGVASRAMFDMLVRLHDLKERGLPVRIVAFNAPRDEEQSRRFADLPGQGPHEAGQAENIAQAANGLEYDRVLVLAGNFHARKGSVTWRGVQFDPMARRLTQYGTTITLNMRFAEGTSWNCVLKPSANQGGKPVTDQSLDCGNHPTRGSADLGPVPFIALASASDADQSGDYDGYFWVGPIRGSPPAAAE